MQTFLPYPSFEQSVAVLDNRRLGKQRVEAMQLVRAIADGGAWSRHPAAIMWQEHTEALMLYHDVCIIEWTQRGFRNTMRMFNPGPLRLRDFPDWLGLPALHASHRSNLLRKDSSHYGQFGWTEPHDLPYVWPRAKVIA